MSDVAPNSAGASPRRRDRVQTGIVTSDKMQKTVVVMVSRRVRDAGYGKYITKRVRYKAHDERNEARVGDRVVIVETRPLSRDKRWRLQRIVDRAQQV